MAASKDPKVNLWRRLRRLYTRRRDRARKRRNAALKRGDAVGARRALRVVRAYSGKMQVALRKLRAARREAAQDGKVVVLAWANRSGHPITSTAMAFFAAVAEKADRTITVSTGTNHSKYTTSGSISDHWSGNAGDFGMSWNNIAAVASAALQVCGWSKSAADSAARRGGLFNVSWKGHRVQVIVNTYLGGNHYNHAHLGVR